MTTGLVLVAYTHTDNDGQTDGTSRDNSQTLQRKSQRLAYKLERERNHKLIFMCKTLEHTNNFIIFIQI